MLHDMTRPASRAAASIVLLALALATKPAAGTETPSLTPLAGDMFIAGATLIDPPPDEPTKTHAYLHLSGAAARKLFDALKPKATADACRPGRHMKTAGPVVCSVGAKPGDAECSFALDLASGGTAPGNAC